MKKVFSFLVSQVLGTPQKLHRIGETFFRLGGFRKTKTSRKNMVVIKLDRLGDLLLCSAFLERLRAALPDSRITLVVRESLASLARLCPAVNEVIGVPVTERVMIYHSAHAQYPGWGRQALKWLDSCRRDNLWRKHFDLAFIPRWSADDCGSIPLAFLTGAKERWGADETASPERARENPGFNALLTKVVPGPAEGNEVQLNERMISAFTGESRTPHLTAWMNDASRHAAYDALCKAGFVDDVPAIALCLGAGNARRMWPVERYVELARRTLDLHTVQLVTFGSDEEHSLGEQFRASLNSSVVQLEGKISLDLLPSALSFCHLYLGSDTGTMHAAASVDLPVLEISCHPLDGDPHWYESPKRFGPWGVPAQILQPATAIPGCSLHCENHQPHCILGVSVDAAETALRLLSTTTGLSIILKS